MKTSTLCALLLCACGLPALARNDAAPQEAVTPVQAAPAAPAQPAAAGADAEPEPAPARVLIEGRRPGPGVWKVSKGEHVMWVFGLYAPLPQKVEWDAGRVERLIARSQEVLLPPGISIKVGFFKGLTMLPSAIGVQKNPDGASLKDILPAEVYARWQLMKGKYIGDDESIEYYRPFFVAERLMTAGVRKNGLSGGPDVRKRIEQIARQDKVKVTSPALDIELEDPRGALKEFKKSSIEDVACFAKTLDNLDIDIDAMKARANAWANGDVAALKSLDYADRERACGDAMFNSPVAKNSPALRNARDRMRAAWLAAAEKSLAENGSTFALLQMADIVNPKGLLSDLQAKGYTVESPK